MNILARLGLILCAVSLSAGISRGEEPAGLDRAAAYFAAVGAEWKKQAPFERHFGHYVGRRLIADSTLTVSIDPAKNEFIVKHFSKFVAAEIDAVTEVRLSPELKIIEMTVTSKISGAPLESDFEIHEGRIKWLHGPKGNPVQGEIKPGYFVGELPMLLPFFVVPPAGEPASAPSLRGDGSFVYRLVETPRDFYVAGKKVHTKAARLEGRWAYPLDALWIPLSEDGHALEIQTAEGPNRIREIPAGQVGKDLDEPLRPLEGYEQPLYDLIMAAKKGDRAAVATVFDFERFATESEGFDKLSPEEKKADIATCEKNILDYFCGDDFRKSLKGQKDLEEVLPACIHSSRDGDTARVAVTGRKGETYVLRKAVGGARDGKWLIQGTEPYKAQ